MYLEYVLHLQHLIHLLQLYSHHLLLNFQSIYYSIPQQFMKSNLNHSNHCSLLVYLYLSYFLSFPHAVDLMIYAQSLLWLLNHLQIKILIYRSIYMMASLLMIQILFISLIPSSLLPRWLAINHLHIYHSQIVILNSYQYLSQKEKDSLKSIASSSCFSFYFSAQPSIILLISLLSNLVPAHHHHPATVLHPRFFALHLSYHFASFYVFFSSRLLFFHAFFDALYL